MVTLNYRKIEPTDNPVLEQIIKKVMTEFGAVGQGYSIEDAEVKAMYDAYANPKSIYYVVEIDGEVSGGGGIGPLIGANPEVCELKKMYFYPKLRGRGAGNRLMEILLEEAVKLGYQKCYLETVERMKLANQLYQKFGFEKANGSLGNTGHTGCDTYYIKDLV
jgi:putative acetyltransferase